MSAKTMSNARAVEQARAPRPRSSAASTEWPSRATARAIWMRSSGSGSTTRTRAGAPLAAGVAVAAGSSTRMVVPRPGAVSPRCVPPCCDDHVERDGEAEPGAALALGREERGEQSAAHLGGHPAARCRSPRATTSPPRPRGAHRDTTPPSVIASIALNSRLSRTSLSSGLAAAHRAAAAPSSVSIRAPGAARRGALRRRRARPRATTSLRSTSR